MIAGAVDLRVQAAPGTDTGRLRAGDGLGLAAGLKASIQALEEGADLLCFELR
jgi:hypothetical protein